MSAGKPQEVVLLEADGFAAGLEVPVFLTEQRDYLKKLENNGQ